MTTLYGIRNCDTIKKARRWLEENGVDYGFHDFRKDGVDEALLRTWLKELDWQLLLNRRSTTWRQLPAAAREQIDRQSALKIMLQQPAIIKRPVLEHHRDLHVGFSNERYAGIFQPETST